jgi:hypothetical protein
VAAVALLVQWSPYDAYAHAHAKAMAMAICPRKTNDARRGVAVRPPIRLTATSQSAQKLLNFGTDRKSKVLRNITLTADRPLPARLTPGQINFDAVLTRTGNTLESQQFPDPTFSNPRISLDRRSMSFSACLSPDGIAAGKYVGLVTVSGPAGLGVASVNLTVNAKDGGLFMIGVIVAIVAAFGLLVVKDASLAKTDATGWGQAMLAPVKDPRWWVTTVATCAAAFGALYTIYANDPAWGAGGWAAVSSLIGAGLSAIGAHSIVTAFQKPTHVSSPHTVAGPATEPPPPE